MTVGNNADVKTNAVCVVLGTITDGGWYLCPASMNGTILGIHSLLFLNYMEAMAYSQEAIQMNAGVTVSYIGTNNHIYPVSNAL